MIPSWRPTYSSNILIKHLNNMKYYHSPDENSPLKDSTESRLFCDSLYVA